MVGGGEREEAGKRGGREAVLENASCFETGALASRESCGVARCTIIPSPEKVPNTRTSFYDTQIHTHTQTSSQPKMASIRSFIVTIPNNIHEKYYGYNIMLGIYRKAFK